MDVSLVIPGRNVAGTIRRCLDAVVPLLRRGELREIIFVDDGSTDDSDRIVAEYPVTRLRVDGLGPGGARNAGWRSAAGDVVWFIDADCVAEDGTLGELVRLLDGPGVAGVGGSYANAREDSLLACLIHEEILERHASMTGEVDYLGSFNVLYRRKALDEVGGFDERNFNAARAPGAEDADLSYRICDRGYTLRFARDSRVAHFHPTRLGSYFRSQRLHGGWGVRLYYRHPGRARRNSYSSWIDHLQPFLAVTTVLALPSLLFAETRWIAPVLIGCLAALQVPMALRLMARTRQWRYAMFVPMGMARAGARGLGVISGVAGLLRSRPEPAPMSRDATCRLCGSASRLLYDLPRGPIRRCRGCGVVFRENLIAGEAATELYQDDGYLDAPYFEALKVGHRRDVEPYLVYGRVLNRLERLTPGRRLLDVGCSYGAFLELARERGWEVTGVDLSAKAAAYATAQRGLPVFTGTLEAAAYPAGTFSAVTMWDVIEHLDDPRGLLREVHRVLAPGGVLVVFTINQGSLINRTGHLLHRLSRGALTRPLVLLYDIHHNFFFDRRTLAQVIHGAGFWGIQRDHLGANIERWQNVPIPPLLALGSKCLDAAAWLTGQHYRVIAYAFK